MINLEEIKKLKEKFFPTEESFNKFLKSVANELLNSKIMDETISPLLLTHKEFIDVSLSRILKKIKEKILKLAKQHNMPLGDKIFEIKLEYLAGYILKYDMANDMIIHKTIAKFILDTIRKDPLKLNHFVSTINKDIHIGKYGKFRYPALYSYDKHKYNNPIPPLRLILTKIDTAKKLLKEKEALLNQIKNELQKAEFELKQISTAEKDMKDIATTLKSKYKDKELKSRLIMLKNQLARFNVLITELNKKITNYQREIKSLTKNIEGIKEKYKDILNKEEELLEILATNLKTMKQKI